MRLLEKELCVYVLISVLAAAGVADVLELTIHLMCIIKTCLEGS